MSNASILRIRPEEASDTKNCLEYKPNIVRGKRLKKSVIVRMCADADVKRWHDNLARSSRLTADVRVRRLETFQKRTKIPPAELVRIGKEDPMKAENVKHTLKIKKHINLSDHTRSVWERRFDVRVIR